MPASPAYPFTPKSNRHLAPGQFWAITLTDGRFACGRVLIVPPWHEDRMYFVGGLMDWVGSTTPAADEIAAGSLLDSALMHVRAISHAASEIIGEAVLPVDELKSVPNPFAVAEGPVAGFKNSVWGLGVIESRAEREFVVGAANT